jgi:hypothetical protein
MKKYEELTVEQVDYIESNFRLKSDEEIAKDLNLKVGEVKKVRQECGFKKQRQTSNRQLITDDGRKWCWYCNKFHPLDAFNLNKNKPSGYQDECRIAQKKIKIERDKKKKQIKNSNIIKTKICESCGEELDISMFIINVSTKDGLSNKCKSCLNKNLDRKFIIKGAE